MSGPLIFVAFVALLMIAARLFLRGERRPPVWPEDPSAGFRDPARPTHWRDRPE